MERNHCLLSCLAYSFLLHFKSQFVSPIKMISFSSLSRPFKISLRCSNARSSTLEVGSQWLCMDGLGDFKREQLQFVSFHLDNGFKEFLQYICCYPKPPPGLYSRGGKIVLEESRGTLSESVFHTIYHHNQLDNVCTRKD